MWSANICHYWTRLSTVRLLLLVLTRPSAPLTLRSGSCEDQQQQPSCLQPRPIMAVIRIPWLCQVIRITAFTRCLCKHRQRVKVDVMASHRYPKSCKYYNRWCWRLFCLITSHLLVSLERSHCLWFCNSNMMRLFSHIKCPHSASYRPNCPLSWLEIQ